MPEDKKSYNLLAMSLADAMMNFDSAAKSNPALTSQREKFKYRVQRYGHFGDGRESLHAVGLPGMSTSNIGNEKAWEGITEQDLYRALVDVGSKEPHHLKYATGQHVGREMSASEKNFTDMGLNPSFDYSSRFPKERSLDELAAMIAQAIGGLPGAAQALAKVAKPAKRAK